MNSTESPIDSGMESSDSPLQRLGSYLEQARVSQGISREALALQLRMGCEQLQALEEADPSRLPEPVFVIAQARRVAAALNLEIDPLIAPLKQGGFSIKAAPAPLQASPNRTGSRPAGRLSAQHYTSRPLRQASAAGGRWIGALALGAGLIAAGTWGFRQRPQLPQLPQFTLAPQPAKPRPPESPKPERARPVTQRPAGQLQLSSSQPSWIEVRNAAGKTLFEGTLKGSRSFAIGSGLGVLAGRPDLVMVRQGDASPRPLGSIDQIQWVLFKGAAAKAPAR